MKTQNIQAVLALTIFALAFSACGPSAAETAAAASPTPNPTPTPKPTPLPYLQVPEDYPTIQGAIDAAVDGYEIVVSPGTYAENIDFNGKNILVRSSDPDNDLVVATTIIDGGGNGSVVIFQSGETNEARLVGFTITNGSGSEISIYDGDSTILAGGAILISGSSSPLIEDNNIMGNAAEGGGGIAVVDESSPTIEGNDIRDNGAKFGGGGIIVIGSSSPMIVGNTFTSNASEYGGGIDVIDNSSPTIDGNTFTGNEANYGGAIVVQYSNTIIVDNTISENNARYYGGAIMVIVNALSTIEGNMIAGNNSGDYGGGIYVSDESSVTLLTNTFSNNESWSGGAIRVESDSILTLNDPDDNLYENNQPDDVYYYGGQEVEEAEYEGLDMIGLEGDETSINQMIANLLDNDPLDPCPVIHEVEAVSGRINPTYLVYISAASEDYFLVVIHTINTDSEPYGSALFGTILEGESGNVIVSAEYPVPEGQTAPDQFEIQVVAPGCEIFTETVSYVNGSTSSATSPFIGTWVSVDPGDGSNQQLTISYNNGVYNLIYFDEIAGSCGLDGAGNSIAADGTGTGTINGDVLSTEFSIWCLSDPKSFLATVYGDYTYHESSDTLTDRDPTTWIRP